MTEPIITHASTPGIIFALVTAAFFFHALVTRPRKLDAAARRIRGESKQQWLETMGDSWSAPARTPSPAQETALTHETHEAWTLERDGARFSIQRAHRRDRFTLELELSERVPRGWALLFVSVPNYHTPLSTVCHELSTHRTYKTLAGAIIGVLSQLSDTSPRLELRRGQLSLSWDTAHVPNLFELFTGASIRSALDSPSMVWLELARIAELIEEIAEPKTNIPPEELFERYERGGKDYISALRGLLLEHPEHTLTHRAIKEVLGTDEPFSRREVMLHAIHESVWDAWQERGGASSYLRARVVAIASVASSPGADAIVADLIERVGTEAIIALLDEHRDQPGDDNLFKNKETYARSFQRLVRSSYNILPPDTWIELVRSDSSTANYSRSEWLTTFRPPREHAIAGLEHLHEHTKHWIACLSDEPDGPDIEGALLDALRKHIEKKWLEDSGAIAEELARREVLTALPLIEEAHAKLPGLAAKFGLEAIKLSDAIAHLESLLEEKRAAHPAGALTVHDRGERAGALTAARGTNAGDLTLAERDRDAPDERADHNTAS